MNWVTGKEFRDMADFTFSLGDNTYHPGDVDCLPNTLHLPDIFPCAVIYTHSMYARQLFYYIRFCQHQVVVITHNGDWNIDDSYQIPPCVVRWYAQNVVSYNPIIESIPIGLENPWWFVAENKTGQMEAKLKEEKNIRKLVFVNHSRHTKPRPRIAAYNYFGQFGWATCKEGVNGHEYPDYLDNVYNHTFVCCPEGNGIDTHRTWEALYMGSIPIEIRNTNNRFYNHLPICFVDRWEDCTYDFLQSEAERIEAMAWDRKELDMNYWRRKIYDKAKSIKELCIA